MVPLTVKSIKVKWFGISSVFYIFVEHCLAAWKYRISLLMLRNIAPILKEKLGKSIWPYNTLHIVPYCVKIAVFNLHKSTGQRHQIQTCRKEKQTNGNGNKKRIIYKINVLINVQSNPSAISNNFRLGIGDCNACSEGINKLWRCLAEVPLYN